jgi:hypothetical protein
MVTCSERDSSGVQVVEKQRERPATTRAGAVQRRRSIRRLLGSSGLSKDCTELYTL